MSVDTSTLIAYSVVLFALIGALFLIFSLKEGHGRFLWLSLPFLMGMCGGASLVDPTILPGRWSGRLAVWFILLAYGFGWQAVRILYGRPVLPGLVILVATVWLVLSATVFQAFELDTTSAALRAFIVALFNGLAARELWRSRTEDLPSRSILLGVFTAYAILAALRVPFVAFLPAPLGSAPGEIWATVVYNLAVVTQALLVSAFLIALSRERVALDNYRMAILDPLTGVQNRRAFEERADAWTRSRRTAASPFGLLVVDIDDFKAINDRYGHDFGDQVIVIAARTAEAVLRKRDVVYRIGGEEFVCLLPDTPAEDAFVAGERLRKAFRAATETVAGHKIGATLSVGVVSMDEPTDLRDLLNRADEALYEAKRAGRNRTILVNRSSGLAAI
ncbi:diguanylate cyclase [Chelatococcus sp. GCM10030263]|uniref:GGDEF domain-containing protein n=1 Tax=Chelatococcus sp. GCM10030263 TaxID=3273387 RepID=UPI003609A3BD